MGLHIFDKIHWAFSTLVMSILDRLYMDISGSSEVTAHAHKNRNKLMIHSQTIHVLYSLTCIKLEFIYKQT
jgi:hypothetical protein